MAVEPSNQQQQQQQQRAEKKATKRDQHTANNQFFPIVTKIPATLTVARLYFFLLLWPRNIKYYEMCQCEWRL